MSFQKTGKQISFPIVSLRGNSEIATWQGSMEGEKYLGVQLECFIQVSVEEADLSFVLY